MIHFFSFITHTKSSKIVLLGELANKQPFGILLKGFFILINYFIEKEGFLDRFVVSVLRSNI
jgi:hypothetical protein